MDNHNVLNDGAFAAILKGGFEIALPSMPEVTLQCRRMPFATTAHVLTTIITSTNYEVAQRRHALLNEIAGLLPEIARGQEGWVSILTSEQGITRLLGIVGPFVSAISTILPELLDRILHDVIIGANASVIQALSTEDGTAILATAFAKMDKALIGKQVSDIFFGLTETLKTVQAAPPQATPEMVKKPSEEEEPLEGAKAE